MTVLLERYHPKVSFEELRMPGKPCVGIWYMDCNSAGVVFARCFETIAMRWRDVLQVSPRQVGRDLPLSPPFLHLCVGLIKVGSPKSVCEPRRKFHDRT